MAEVQLLGRVLIKGKIEAKTGLHIGGSPGTLAIGNVDMPVIRNVSNNQPYIPGSSLKGKMRSLSEKWSGAPQNKIIHKGKEDGIGQVKMHVAESFEEYKKYWVNPLFGITGDSGNWMTAPNRLIVRDVALSEDSMKKLLKTKTDMPYTEVKWEAAIDRVTSAATPRQIERVPAGTVFGPMELIFNVFLKEDINLLGYLFTAMQLIEDDYLGGQGSRGSGKVAFLNLTVELRHGKDYAITQDKRFMDLESLDNLLDIKDELLKWVSEQLKLGV